jgi:Spy/CpxP family protein refolding chaperone
MWKMMEALNLDKPTAEKIMEIRHKFVDQRKALQREIGDDFRTLRQLLRDTAGTTSDDELTKVLTRIHDKRLRIKGLFDEQYNEVSKVLTVRQRAELVLFLKDFHKEIRSILRPSGFPNMSQDRRIMPQRPPQERKSSGDQDEEVGPPLDQ